MRPGLTSVLELLKPVTWFPPMWAFACGVVASGQSASGRGTDILTGVLLAGPLVCGTSQAVNDWFDRHVDAINEPNRPIPSGRLPGRRGLHVAWIWTALSLLVALRLGPWGFGASVVALALAWAYSAPPFRLKRNGWIGNAACALCYEGLAWLTGASVMAGGGIPPLESLWLAALYSLGAHGIMTLNDFKSIEGDRRFGIDSLPVMLGAPRAADVACVSMAAAQLGVVLALMGWGHPMAAAIVGALLLIQLGLMQRFRQAPVARAVWYSGFGVMLYVTGMMVSAVSLR